MEDNPQNAKGKLIQAILENGRLSPVERILRMRRCLEGDAAEKPPPASGDDGFSLLSERLDKRLGNLRGSSK